MANLHPLIEDGQIMSGVVASEEGGEMGVTKKAKLEQNVVDLQGWKRAHLGSEDIPKGNPNNFMSVWSLKVTILKNTYLGKKNQKIEPIPKNGSGRADFGSI